ncbi:alpha/beta hydrolase [Amycolatopsis sp. YIM 10]|uniref:alpha/beta hydrolase n=1 Tax=Amycolatopsis sp. YIM 10 TaxID=2653857 RepID=UPI0012900573|nr:Tripeptidyl aminopeptidase precursor [Amycolatopsis sp. YIM 10]
MSLRKTLLPVLVTALAASLVAGVPAAMAETLSWGDCPADAARPGLQCATLDVPLDYRDPGGRTIEVAVSRLASADPEKRRGVLLTNTGGPGGEGLIFPAILRDNLKIPREVLDSYDVIGMDPRGVGHSTPVTCDLKPEQWFTNIPLYARNPADVAAQAEQAKAAAAQCGASATAPMLPHITTANTARDLDRVRAALGESTVSYFGISYGTYLGSVYTTLFPHRSDRILIDSATGPGGWDAGFTRMFGEGFEDRFPDFAKFAAAHPEYGLGTTPEQVTAKYFELGARLDATPSPEGVNGQVFRHGTFARFYYDSEFPGLAAIWQALDTGKPLPPAPQPGTAEAAAPVADNYLASQLHVICNDSDWPESVGHYQRNVAIDRFRHPMFGAAAANVTPCAFWPSEPAEPPVKIGDDGPSNVLIVQNLRDPATPLAGAKKLRRAFGDRARLVTADQGGHLAYLYLDNRCANDIATNFLLTGQRPAHDRAC